MKKTRFTETQIVSILSQQESGMTVRDICQEHTIAEGFLSVEEQVWWYDCQ